MIIFFLAHVAAACYNYYIITELIRGGIDNTNPLFKRLSNSWHLWQSIFNAIIALFIGLYCSPYLGFQFIAVRFLIFNPVLNLLLGNPIFYFGKDRWDVCISKLLGKYAGLLYFLLGIIIVAGLYALHYYCCWMNKTIIPPYHCLPKAV